jgi:hypothetical protein
MLAIIAIPTYIAWAAWIVAVPICPGSVQATLLNVVGVLPVFGPPIAVVLGIAALTLGTSRRGLSWTGVCLGAAGLLFYLIPLSYGC